MQNYHTTYDSILEAYLFHPFSMFLAEWYINEPIWIWSGFFRYNSQISSVNNNY